MTHRHTAFLLGLCLSVAPAFGAAVTVTNQNRSVHVAIPGLGDIPAVDETIAAPDNGTFDETLERQVIGPDIINTATASQLSSFGELDDVFTATAQGSTSYTAAGTPGIVFSESQFSLTFTLAEERAYTIQGGASFPDTGSGASDFAVTLTGPGGTVHSFTKADFNPGLNDGAQINPTFNESGTLAAGEYTLAADSGVSGGTNLNEILASFDVTFTATLDDGTEPPPPGVIPLPAAAWPGFMMLSGLGVAAWKRRRHTA
jgi:hypothetical protein